MSAALALARGLAEHMNGWRAEPFVDMDEREIDHGAYLVGPDDVRLFVRTGQYSLRGRAEISVHHELPPGTRLYDIPHPKITVSLDREPSAAARDILHRLVPEAVKATAEVRERIAAEAARKTEVASLVQRLTESFPDLTLSPQFGRDAELSWSPKGNGYGTVTISYGANSAEIRLRSLSIEQLVLVLQAIK